MKTDTTEKQRELVILLQSVATGDRSSLKTLYDRTSAKLYGICLRVLHDQEDAEDVLQSVYLTVWRKAVLFDPSKASVITWLAVLTRNRAVDRLRQTHRPTEGLDAVAEVADDRMSAVEVLEQAEDRTRLSHCLDELDERPRSMIRAAFLDGASYPDLAKREGVPLPTMKSWVRRALLRLRGCMER